MQTAKFIFDERSLLTSTEAEYSINSVSKAAPLCIIIQNFPFDLIKSELNYLVIS